MKNRLSILGWSMVVGAIAAFNVISDTPVDKVITTGSVTVAGAQRYILKPATSNVYATGMTSNNLEVIKVVKVATNSNGNYMVVYNPNNIPNGWQPIYTSTNITSCLAVLDFVMSSTGLLTNTVYTNKVEEERTKP